MHYQKYIKLFIQGEKSTRGKGRGPNGRAVHSKAMTEQKKLHGAVAEKVLEGVHASLMEGAAHGHNTTIVTAYKPPEMAAIPGLPAWRAPDNWAVSNVTYCWDSSLLCFFSPVEGGVGALMAASEYLVSCFAEKGFKAVAKQDASGFSYEISGTADD